HTHTHMHKDTHTHTHTCTHERTHARTNNNTICSFISPLSSYAYMSIHVPYTDPHFQAPAPLYYVKTFRHVAELSLIISHTIQYHRTIHHLHTHTHTHTPVPLR